MSAPQVRVPSSGRLPRIRFYPAASRRTLANAAMIEGFFAFTWFGWGQEGPPPPVSVVLAVGACLALLIALGGLVAARRVRGEPAPLIGPAAGRRFGIIVGIEFGASGVGAAVLGVTGHGELIAAWVCLVVGVHFVPLSRVFPGIGLVGLAALISLVGIAAFVIGLTTALLPSTITGLGAGGCLLGHAASLLLATARGTSPARWTIRGIPES